MKKIVFAVALAIVATSSNSADLFKDDKPVDFVKDSILAPGTTVAGYPIFKGDGEWRLQNVTSFTANTTGSTMTSGSGLGWISLNQKESNGEWFANLLLLVSTLPAGGDVYSTGTPCGGSHMVTVNKGGGRDDNCLTIDAANFQSGSRFVTYFNVAVTQTRSGGRRYIMTLQLNAELLGFRETAPADWNNADLLQLSPSRTAFALKIKDWASLLQNGSEHILDFSKPQNGFDGIPSYRTLLPVPSDLADGSYSQNFIGAVESTKNKPAFRAIAYTKLSPGRIRWNNEYARESQEAAEKVALENCEKGRASNAERCKLYNLDKDVPRVSLKATSNQVSSKPSTGPSADTLFVEKRLSDLKNLLDKGLISREIFNQKREEILKAL